MSVLMSCRQFAVHNTVQNSSGNHLVCTPHNHHCSNDVQSTRGDTEGIVLDGNLQSPSLLQINGRKTDRLYLDGT